MRYVIIVLIYQSYQDASAGDNTTLSTVLLQWDKELNMSKREEKFKTIWYSKVVE
jgi:hypothetical protein